MKDIESKLQSSDPNLRNQALRALYMDPVINGKVKHWANQYNLTICEPDDILQEAIILMDEKIRNGSFQGKSKVRTFLLGICFNMIRDQKKKVNRIDLKGEFYDSEQMPEELQYDLMQIHEKTKEEEDREVLLGAALGDLKEKCRDLLKDYYYKQMSMAQIAEKLNYGAAQTANTAVYRCREKLRKLILKNPTLTKKLKELI